MEKAGGKGHRDLVAWQKAMDLVVVVYEVSASWPREETYGLRQQARRAAVSIPANLAEGFGRNSRREYRQFVGIACGSLLELETELLVAQRLSFGDLSRLPELLDRTAEIGRLLNGLRRSLTPTSFDEASITARQP